jgi:hypothetical protein
VPPWTSSDRRSCPPRLGAPALASAVAIVALVAPALAAGAATPPARAPFRIEVVDRATGRGVPMVELATTSGTRLWTDSAGIVSFLEPGLMGEEVWFGVQSHGYEVAPDGFGHRGVRLRPVSGDSARVAIDRRNVAERLYRVTGEGIYRDTVLTGGRPPLRRPLLAGGVAGQDSVLVAPYRGRLYWIWGDTHRTGYPLGNFAASGATSELPGRGGLDPAAGVDLEYFTGHDRFSRPMCPLPGPGLVWLDALTPIRDATGRECLVARYSRPREPDSRTERGLVRLDDQADRFTLVRRFRPGEAAHLYTKGYCCAHPFSVDTSSGPYTYFAMPYPGVRIAGTWREFVDPAAYESFTCLAPGTRYSGANTRLDRGPDGGLRWSWKRDTGAVGPDELVELTAAGAIRADECWWALRDVDSARPVRAKSGSVHWNEWRRRWIGIIQEIEGTSFLGEVWYAEADTPTGPWCHARKIVTHDQYSFYNPTQHPLFDELGGRLVYFEGTCANTFSGNPERTPRYDYNQIMYRLDLSDPRLHLPAPVYRLRAAAPGRTILAMRDAVERQGAWDRVDAVAFYALAPDRPLPGTVAIHQDASGRLSVEVPARAGSPAASSRRTPLCLALPAAAPVPRPYSGSALARLTASGHATDDAGAGPGRGDGGGGARATIGWVWPCPTSVLGLDVPARVAESSPWVVRLSTPAPAPTDSFLPAATAPTAAAAAARPEAPGRAGRAGPRGPDRTPRRPVPRARAR